jgi:hypothetical protein
VMRMDLAMGGNAGGHPGDPAIIASAPGKTVPPGLGQSDRTFAGGSPVQTPLERLGCRRRPADPQIPSKPGSCSSGVLLQHPRRKGQEVIRRNAAARDGRSGQSLIARSDEGDCFGPLARPSSPAAMVAINGWKARGGTTGQAPPRALTLRFKPATTAPQPSVSWPKGPHGSCTPAGTG